MQWQVTNASRDSNGRLVLDVKYVLTPSVHGSSQWYMTRKPRGLYGESVTATAWPQQLWSLPGVGVASVGGQMPCSRLLAGTWCKGGRKEALFILQKL